MFPYGNGFNTINHREYHIIEENFLTLSLIKHKLKLAGHNYFWIWIAIKSVSQTVRPYLLGNHISSERNMLIAERFLNSLINKYGRKHITFQQMAALGIYSQACKYLKLKHHHIHSSNEKNLMIEVQSNT